MKHLSRTARARAPLDTAAQRARAAAASRRVRVIAAQRPDTATLPLLALAVALLAALFLARPLLAAGPDAWRAIPPPLQAAPALPIPSVSEGRLENGLTVRVIHRPHLPIAAVGLAFRTGAAADPAGREGLASVAWHQLLDHERQFAQLGAEPEVVVDADGARWRVRVLPADLPATLDRLAGLLAAPAAGQGDLARAVRSADRRARRTDDTLSSVLFAGSAYGSAVEGTQASRAALGVGDLLAFRARHVVPGEAALVIAGPVDLEEGLRLARAHLGDWRSTGRSLPAAPAAVRATNGGVHRMSGLGGSARLEIGLPLVAAGDPQEAALRVAATAFHGRLGNRLRTRTGYAYRVRTEPWFGRAGGLVRSEASVDVARADDALAQIRRAVRDLPRLVTEDTVDFYRHATLERLAEAWDTVEGSVDGAAGAFVRGLPADYPERLAAAVRQVDANDVRAAVARHLGADRLHVVVRGGHVASR